MARTLLGKGLAEIRANYATESPWKSYPNADWCAWLTSWLLRGNGTGFESWVDNMYRFGTTVGTPQTGDIVIFPDYHVGLVSKVVGGVPYVIDGNGGDLPPMSTVVQERPAWSPRIFVRPRYTGQPAPIGDAGPVSPAFGAVPLLLPGGQLALYAIKDGNLWGTAQPTAGGSFGPWSLIGSANGTLIGRPAIVRTVSGLIAAYARTTAGTIVGSSQSVPGGPFGGWGAVGSDGGGIASDPAAIVLQNGVIAVYASTGAGTVSGVAQSVVGGGFGRWQQIASSAPTALTWRPAVAQLADGRLAIYVHGADGLTYGTAQSVAGGTFTPWAVMGAAGGNAASEPVVSVTADGRISLYVTAVNGTIAGVSQSAAGQPFGTWANFGAGAVPFQATTPGLVPLADGSNALYMVGGDGSVWGATVAPGQTAAPGWAPIGSGASLVTAVTAKQASSGQIVVYGMRLGAIVVGAGQFSAGGSFGDWTAIG